MPGHWILRIIGVAIFAGIFLAGCDRTPQTDTTEYIIKAGPVVVTPTEFVEELDLKLSAYPYDIKNTPDQYNEVLVDLVATLSEETLLLAVAREKGITVTSSEVEAAKARVKETYPENSFDQMLLENAISQLVWENRLEKSLVIEKLVQQELIDKIHITADDVKSFFEKHQTKEASLPDKEGLVDETELVAQLRRQKGQMLYQEWVYALKQDLSVDINKPRVAQMLIGNEKKGTFKKGISND
ncbi:MAG: SurA N-terminal domain-containing protein [Desulfotignum sp.]